MMHGVVAADTCTVPKEMCVSGEKSLINTHSCALGDEVVKISGMVDVSPLKFWCVMISPRSEIMALENLDAPTCVLSKEPQRSILCCHSKLIVHVWRRSLNDACYLWENLAVPFMFSKRQSIRLNDCGPAFFTCVPTRSARLAFYSFVKNWFFEKKLESPLILFLFLKGK